MAAVVPSVNSLIQAEECSESASSSSEPARQVLSRRDTEQILDYYQSEHAGRTYSSLKGSYISEGQAAQGEPEMSTSTRPTLTPRGIGRDSHGDDHTGRASLESVASSSSGVQRRTSQRSAGGADKRRLAIIEMDSKRGSKPSSGAQLNNTFGSFAQPPLDHNLYAERRVDSSHLGGFALMGLPDAEPSNYTDLTLAPASAPAAGITPISWSTKREPSPSGGHQRSISDIQPRTTGSHGSKAAPRDVGIVGTLETILPSSLVRLDSAYHERQRPSSSDGDIKGDKDRSSALTAPVFQTPRSRSPPSPLPLTGDSSSQPTAGNPSVSARAWTAGPGMQLTPSIGQEKEVGRPVAGPVVLDLSSGHPVIRYSPRIMPSSLPTTDPPTSTPRPYGDCDPQRTAGRLPFKPHQSGPSYVHYQPGVHSIAGPLPSPPRHILTQPNSSPPPRPPRLLSPPRMRRTESEQSKSVRLPYADEHKTSPVTSLRLPILASRADSDLAITAVSVSSRASTSNEKSPESSPKTPEEIEPVPKPSHHKATQDETLIPASRNGSHVREGAFPASSVFFSRPPPSVPPKNQNNTLDELVAALDEGMSNANEDSPSTGIERTMVLGHSQSPPALKRESSWVSLGAESLGDGVDDASPPSSYPSSRAGSSHMLATNLPSDHGHTDRRRASLPATPHDPQQRFHPLPRTPSILSVTDRSRSQTSSPSLPSLHRKAPSSWPEAMNFQDILAKKSAAERALAYAAKIRDLANEETGLRDWLALNGRRERRETAPSTLLPSVAAPSRALSKLPRHVSRSSMASEVTFPIRPDYYTATDLSVRPTVDMSPPTLPPTTLPYPSLAHGVGIRRRPSYNFTTDSSTRGLASPASSSKSLSSGFFASIGRKASIRKDRTFGSNPSTKLMSSRRAAPLPQPRPVKIGTPPTLPGGPRPPARSAQHTNSVAFTPTEHPRLEGQLTVPTRSTLDSTETFHLQVEKLSDLLPQADKEVLASYLRRAYNQDPMAAIGTYLEDEKMGLLRSD